MLARQRPEVPIDKVPEPRASLGPPVQQPGRLIQQPVDARQRPRSADRRVLYERILPPQAIRSERLLCHRRVADDVDEIIQQLVRRADEVDARKKNDFELGNSVSFSDAADALSPQAGT